MAVFLFWQFNRYFRGLVGICTFDMEQAADQLVPRLLRLASLRGSAPEGSLDLAPEMITRQAAFARRA